MGEAQDAELAQVKERNKQLAQQLVEERKRVVEEKKKVAVEKRRVAMGERALE